MIISSSYLVHEQKILYLCHGEPLVDGVLDMEKLDGQSVAENRGASRVTCQSGPLPVDGTSEFLAIFTDRTSRSVSTCVYQLPDSYGVSLLADYENQCEFSTFLKGGEILLKINQRFMVFDKTGNFIC
jgi:hypothetical protein